MNTMTLSRLELKTGVDPRYASKVLAEQIQEAGAIGGSVGFEHVQHRFLTWAESGETRLHYLTQDLKALTMFDSARARMIRELGSEPVRPWPLVDAEVKLQVSVLERMLADLQERIARVDLADAHAVVVDTNVLLHYQPLDQLPWHELAKDEQVRVILPLRVIEELDQKKYSQRKKLATRARRVLPQLRSWLGPIGAPSQMATGTTLEVMVDPGPRQRPADADEEILANCRELIQFGTVRLSLLSADTAMAIRAEAEQIPVIALSEHYLRNPDPG